MYLVYFYVDVMYVCCNKLTYNLEHLATNLTKCSAFLSVLLAVGCHNRDQQPPTESSPLQSVWVSTLVTSYHTVPASPPCPQQCRDEGVPCVRRAAAQPRRPHLGPGRGRGGQTQALAQAEDGEAEGDHDNNDNVQCQPRSPCSGPVLVPHHGGRGRPGSLLRRGRGQRGDRAGAARGHLPGAVQYIQHTVLTVQYSSAHSLQFIPFAHIRRTERGSVSAARRGRRRQPTGNLSVERKSSSNCCSIAVCIMFIVASSQVSRQQTLLLQN